MLNPLSLEVNCSLGLKAMADLRQEPGTKGGIFLHAVSVGGVHVFAPMTIRRKAGSNARITKCVEADFFDRDDGQGVAIIVGFLAERKGATAIYLWFDGDKASRPLLGLRRADHTLQAWLDGMRLRADFNELVVSHHVPEKYLAVAVGFLTYGGPTSTVQGKKYCARCPVKLSNPLCRSPHPDATSVVAGVGAAERADGDQG